MMNEERTTVRRGYEREDDKWFSGEALKKLIRAQEEVQWLLDRGYKIKAITELVGNHYQLAMRQRNALQRATSSRAECECRNSKMLKSEDIKKGCIYIDGFNLIITLEVALSKGTLILGNDGVVRDLAGLRGTYRLVDKTDKALTLLGLFLNEYKSKYVKFYIDAPVSNSGRLKSAILQHSLNWNIPTEVEVLSSVDSILSTMERVVTSDSIILNACGSWFNLSRNIIERYLPEVEVINFNKMH